MVGGDGVTILAIDGGKNVGYALFTETGEDIERGVISHETFFSGKAWSISDYVTGGKPIFVGAWYIHTPVVEGIRHNPMISQGGSQRWESQVEGAMRMLGALTDVPVEVQPASILPVAMIQNQYPKPVTRTGKPKHLPDQDAAWLHGRYFLVAKGIID